MKVRLALRWALTIAAFGSLTAGAFIVHAALGFAVGAVSAGALAYELAAAEGSRP